MAFSILLSLKQAEDKQALMICRFGICIRMNLKIDQRKNGINTVPSGIFGKQW